MDNKTPNMPIVDSPQSTEAQPSANRFLVILLSILLVISVSIAGFFAYQTQVLVKELTLSKVTPTPVSMVEPTSEPVVADPTADWKMYQSTDLGFTFKYPKYFTISQEGWSRIGTNNRGNWVLNLHSENPKVDFLIDYRENPVTAGGAKITTVEQSIQGVEYSKTTFLGYPAVLFESTGIGGMESKNINVLKGNTLWHIYILNWDGKPESFALFDQILSTFKFTN